MMRPLRGEEILLRKDKNGKSWIPLEEMRGMIVCGKCVWVVVSTSVPSPVMSSSCLADEIVCHGGDL